MVRAARRGQLDFVQAQPWAETAPGDGACEPVVQFDPV